MSGPDPKGTVELVIEPDEDFSFVLEALEELFANARTPYNERMLAITGKSALENIRVRLATARKRAEEAEKERDALAKENLKLRGERESVERQAKSILAVLHS